MKKLKPYDVVRYSKAFLQQSDICPTDPRCFASGDVLGFSPSGELARVDWGDEVSMAHPGNLVIAGTLEPQ